MTDTTDGSARSKHIFVVQTDIVDYKDHMKLDAVMQKCLDESENQRLRNPITPDDYLELFKTIVIKTGYLIKYKSAEDRVSVVKAKFLEPGIESPEWKDFTRMLDMCVERERFRAVRVMCKHAYFSDGR